MKIAVTGATGFIGRHLLPLLRGRNQEMVAVTREAARLGSLSGLAQVVEMDLSSPPAGAYDRLGRPDVLLHLAWDGLPNYKSRRHFEVELPVQYRFLKDLLEDGLPSLVVTGTCFEYGPQSGPLPAGLETRPDNPYGFAKDALRKQLELLKRELPFRFTWARLFYMYGDGQSPASIYSQLREAVKRGDRRFDMSGGEQLRDYLRVEAVAELLARLTLLRPDAGPVNVCSGVPRSVRALVESWIQENRWDIELNLGHYPYPDYEPMAFWGDRQCLDAVLGGP